jgi:hypothetical protein
MKNKDFTVVATFKHELGGQYKIDYLNIKKDGILIELNEEEALDLQETLQGKREKIESKEMKNNYYPESVLVFNK